MNITLPTLSLGTYRWVFFQKTSLFVSVARDWPGFPPAQTMTSPVDSAFCPFEFAFVHTHFILTLIHFQGLFPELSKKIRD